ncbi:MAG: hypothetical protein ACK5OG_03990, partial [Sphingomonadaceae bacterium]
MLKSIFFSIPVWFALVPKFACAQSGDLQLEEATPPALRDDEIIVTADRLPGSVSTDVLPLEVLSSADIAAY